MDVAGKHVVITGGSQGIGLETARLMAQRGGTVSIVARTEARLRDAADDIGRTGHKVEWVSADVTDPHAVDDALTELADRNGPCELLVTCAGIAHPGYFDELDLAVFHAQMDLIYFGTLHAIRAVLPGMVERGSGGLVGVSSGAALIGVFGYGAYAPAKYVMPISVAYPP